MRFASPLVAQDRDDFGVHRGIIAIQIDDAQQLVALGGKQLRNVITGTDLIVGVAREVVPKRIARAAKDFEGTFLQASISDGDGHEFLLSGCWRNRRLRAR